MRWLRAKSSQSRHRAEVTPVEHHKFDDQTGQIYTETTVAARKPVDHDWPHRPRASVEWIENVWRNESGRHAPLLRISRKKMTDGQSSKKTSPDRLTPLNASDSFGARSLVDVAMELILQKVEELSIEVLQDVPPILLQKIWDQIRTRRLLSFHTWQVFSTLLRGHDDSLRLHRYRDQIQEPSSNLSIYTSPLASESFGFLTFLSITTLFSVPDLVKLHTLRNLVALEIICGEKPYERTVSDRLIRAWSIAAENEGAFPVLRILKLWQHPQVTNTSLAYIDSFPSLAIYDITGCGFDRKGSMKSRKAGWSPTIDANLLQRLEAACVERAMVMRATLGKKPSTLRKTFARQLSDEAPVSLLPRAQVPEFLTRDEIVTRSQSKKISSGLDQTSSRRAKSDKQVKTWESSIYMKICKIGELRNDGDLKRAGIEVADQPIVNNELISPLPIACLRLGPTPLSLLLCTDPIYSGSRFHENFGTEPSPIPVKSGPYETLQSQRLAFMRIKYDSQEFQPLQETVNSSDYLKRPTSAASRPTSSGESAPAKRRWLGLQRKKKDISDVLGSFLS